MAGKKVKKVGDLSGIVSPIIAFTCILTAVTSSESFSWTNNALSDLGVAKGVTAPLFNFGLVVSGVLAFAFVVLSLLPYFHDNLVGKVGASFFAVSSLDLILIGIFNENFRPTHYVVSVVFFVAIPISLLILTAAFAIKHQIKMASLSIVVAVLAAMSWILNFSFGYVSGVAIPETISGAAAAIWIITLSYKVLKEQ